MQLTNTLQNMKTVSLMGQICTNLLHTQISYSMFLMGKDETTVVN